MKPREPEQDNSNLPFSTVPPSWLISCTYITLLQQACLIFSGLRLNARKYIFSPTAYMFRSVTSSNLSLYASSTRRLVSARGNARLYKKINMNVKCIFIAIIFTKSPVFREFPCLAGNQNNEDQHNRRLVVHCHLHSREK